MPITQVRAQILDERTKAHFANVTEGMAVPAIDLIEYEPKFEKVM